jgi:hypothetical protein
LGPGLGPGHDPNPHSAAPKALLAHPNIALRPRSFAPTITRSAAHGRQAAGSARIAMGPGDAVVLRPPRSTTLGLCPAVGSTRAMPDHPYRWRWPAPMRLRNVVAVGGDPRDGILDNSAGAIHASRIAWLAQPCAAAATMPRWPF